MSGFRLSPIFSLVIGRQESLLGTLRHFSFYRRLILPLVGGTSHYTGFILVLSKSCCQ